MAWSVLKPLCGDVCSICSLPSLRGGYPALRCLAITGSDIMGFFPGSNFTGDASHRREGRLTTQVKVPQVYRSGIINSLGFDKSGDQSLCGADLHDRQRSGVSPDYFTVSFSRGRTVHFCFRNCLST